MISRSLILVGCLLVLSVTACRPDGMLTRTQGTLPQQQTAPAQQGPWQGSLSEAEASLSLPTRRLAPSQRGPMDLLRIPYDQAAAGLPPINLLPSVPGGQGLQLTPLSYEQIPGWPGIEAQYGLAALRKSCVIYNKRPGSRQVHKDYPFFGRYQDWHPVCRALLQTPGMHTEPGALAFLKRWMQPYLVSYNGNPNGKFTGYFSASLRGSYKPSRRFRYPVYGRPSDLIKQPATAEYHQRTGKKHRWVRPGQGGYLPYHTRAEIEQGALRNKAPVLFWTDNAEDLFFMHIQGSGYVSFPDGSQRVIGFAGRNGHPFTSIGTIMIQNGWLEAKNTNMDSIKAWMQANPHRAVTLRQRNASYIFFDFVEDSGPIGAMGVAVTPRHTLAVDPKYIPYGVPLWVTVPANYRLPRPISQLMVAQDTGAAIKGPIRGDFFWGAGPDAEKWAGPMNNSGQYFVLLPRR